MGATSFTDGARVARATPTRDVFASLQGAARDAEGRGGYTGTLAEKTEFRMAPATIGSLADFQLFLNQTLYHCPGDDSPYSADLIEKVCDKWGPAYCARFPVTDTEDEVIFFGMAPT